MVRVLGSLYLGVALLVLISPCSATEYTWSGMLHMNEHSSPVALEAGRAADADEKEMCEKQIDVVVALEASTTAELKKTQALAASVFDECGGVALVTLSPLDIDETANNVSTWVGSAIWAGTPCKSSSQALSMKVGLAGSKDQESVTLLKCTIKTACISGEASHKSIVVSDSNNTLASATHALGHTRTRTRTRRGLCGGIAPVLLSATPYVFGSNIDVPIYNPNMDCTWYLNAPPGAVVFVRFTAFNTEVCCDIVFVHNGDEPDPVFPGGRCSGPYIPGPFMSTGNLIRIDFQSDYNVQLTGFVAEATSRYICRTGYPINATMNNTLITTGAPDSTYPASAYCVWFLTAPEGERVKISFSIFDTEQALDTLSVFDGTESHYLFGVFSGTGVPASIVSTSNSMRLVFESDDTIELLGFVALFTFTTEPPSELSPCFSLPPPVINGNVSICAGTLSDTNCTPECDHGFSSVGEYACYGSIWSGTASCHASPCFTAPTVASGETQHCAGLPSGRTCIPNCDTGFTLSGKLTCSFGEWVGTATCNANPCRTVPPPVADGNVTFCKNTKSGDTCTPKCDQGFTDINSYFCNLGQWIGNPLCEASPCTTAAPSVPHGSTLGCAGTESGKECAPACESGYTAAGEYLCTKGVWSGTATCSPNPCDMPPAVANGNVSACADLASGNTCKPVCDEGFTAFGEFSCTAGTWSGSPFCQANPCDTEPPAVANGNVSACRGLASGDVCEPVCEESYNVVGQFLCYAGAWVGTPSCVKTAAQTSGEKILSPMTISFIVSFSILGLVLGLLLVLWYRRRIPKFCYEHLMQEKHLSEDEILGLTQWRPQESG